MPGGSFLKKGPPPKKNPFHLAFMEEPTRYNVTVTNSSSTDNGASSPPGGTDVMVDDAFAQMYSFPALKPFVLACCAYHVSA